MSIIIVVLKIFSNFVTRERKRWSELIQKRDGRNEMNNNVMTFNLIVLKIFPNFVIQKEGEREKKRIDPEGGWKESWRRKKGAVCVSAWVVCDRSGARGWTVVDRK